MNGWHRPTVLSSVAFLPALLVLASFASWFALPVFASLVVTLLYHATWETQLVRTDHALAYSVIGCNFWMAYHTHAAWLTGLGVVMVLLGLYCYRSARTVPGAYELDHSVWHLCCGAANLCFATAYVTL
jgi:hypothetical protein